MFLILFHSKILKLDGGNKDDYGKGHFPACSYEVLILPMPSKCSFLMIWWCKWVLENVGYFLGSAFMIVHIMCSFFINQLQIDTALFLWNGNGKYFRLSGSGNEIISGLIVEIWEQYVSIDILKLSMACSERTTKYKI